LDADPAGGRPGLREAVVDVGTDRVQRHAALRVGLRAAHLRAAEAAAAGDLDPLGARADRGGERTLHRAPERDAVHELLGDRLRDELRVELRPLDLVDVDVHVLLRDRVQLLTERVDLDARLADHDAGARRVDVDVDPLLVLADQDVGQAGVRELLVDVLPDLDVLDQVLGELLLARVPVRLPVVDDADAHPAGMNFLTHYAFTSFFLAGALRFGFSVASALGSSAFAAGLCGAAAFGFSIRRTVMWQVRLRMRATRPRARARQRLIVGPSSIVHA